MSRANLPNGSVLHFTIGPVQEFIADARRLRDYWAGSFLLSLLAGHAMVAVERAYATEHGGDFARNPGAVQFPRLKGDELYQALASADETSAVYIGSLPNRFKANVGGLPETIAADCRQAVLDAWQHLCDRVWQEYIAPVCDRGKNVKHIWDSQTTNFWDMSWAVGVPCKTGDDGAWLDQRKNWRRLRPELEEGGDHCRLMGLYQELSGYHRVDRGEREAQAAFWNALRARLGGMKDGDESTVNLGRTERLCSLAFIKRAFPVLLDEGGIDGLIPWTPGGSGGSRNLSVRNWPSTSYIAALPWLRLITEEHDVSSSTQHIENALNKAGFRQYHGETDTKLFGFDPRQRFFSLDGHLFHQTGVASLVKERSADESTAQAHGLQRELLAQLEMMNKKIGSSGKGGPSAFYAILRMDGDSVGARLGTNAGLIREGLFDFTNRVKNLFNPSSAERNPYFGALIYAGGDDVLAFLPVDEAISAALRLRKEYHLAFLAACREENVSEDIANEFTLSASVVYTHFKNPLSAALRLSEQVLNDGAKNGNGRNSIALAVSKPGGIAAAWANVFSADTDKDLAETLQSVARGSLTGSGDAALSGRFFYNMKQILSGISTSDLLSHESVDEMTLLQNLLRHTLARQFESANAAENDRNASLARELSAILMPYRRVEEKNGVFQSVAATDLSFGGGMIMRFLSTEERQARSGNPNDGAGARA